MDDPLPSTPAGDTIFEETNNSTQSERDPKNDGVVLTQPTMEKPVTPLILSNEVTQDAQDLPSRDDENPQDVRAPLV